jgi:NDP-sugar pyrophosphorylase family protein
LPAGTSMKGPIQSSTLRVSVGSVVEGPVLLGAGVSIAEDSTIGGGTSLGQDTMVQRNASLTRCLTLPGTQVQANADLHDAILDAHGNVVR